MASSFLEYKGHGIWIRDTMYALTMHLVYKTILEQTERPNWFVGLEEKIRLISLDYYFSFKTLPLDNELTDDARKTYFISILHRTADSLSQGDEELSAEELNIMWKGSESPELTFTSSISKKLFTKLLQHIILLVEGRLPYTVNDNTEVMWSSET